MANKAEQLKIILLGDEKVGKSSFFNKFVNGTFTEEYSPSLKAQFKKVDFNLIGEQLAINIWDTPGNEQKHKIYNSIYVKSHGIIILFNIANKASFENIFTKWIPNFFNFLKLKKTDNFPIIILGNFQDLDSKREISKQEIQTKLKENIQNFTSYFFYQEISIKKENSLNNFMTKALLFIKNRPKEIPNENKEEKMEIRKETEQKEIKEQKENKQEKELKEEKEEKENKEEMAKKEENKEKEDKNIKEIGQLKEKIKGLETERNILKNNIKMFDEMKKIFTDKQMKDKEEKIMLNQTIKRLESEKDIHAKHQKVEENEKGILNDKIQTLQLQKEILSKDLEEKIENDKKNKVEIEKLQQKINELNEYITKKDNEMKNILETQKSEIGNEENEKNELKASINKLNESIKEKDNIIKEFKEKYDSENQVKN